MRRWHFCVTFDVTTMMAGKNQAALAVCAQTKVIFPFKKKVLPSHPSCSHISQWIKLSWFFHFPKHWDWLKWFQFLKSWKSWHYWTYCHFCLMVQASISLWLLKPFPNRPYHIISYHIISCVHRDTYLYVNFEKHIWSFSWLFLQSVLDHHHLVFFFFVD